MRCRICGSQGPVAATGRPPRYCGTQQPAAGPVNCIQSFVWLRPLGRTDTARGRRDCHAPRRPGQGKSPSPVAGSGHVHSPSPFIPEPLQVRRPQHLRQPGPRARVTPGGAVVPQYYVRSSQAAADNAASRLFLGMHWARTPRATGPAARGKGTGSLHPRRKQKNCLPRYTAVMDSVATAASRTGRHSF
jgi:hypothetical protein